MRSDYIGHYCHYSPDRTVAGPRAIYGIGTKPLQRCCIMTDGRSGLPVSVESLVGPVHCENRSSGVRFGHSAIPFEHYHFGPYLVVDLRPFVQHFLYVILQTTNAAISIYVVYLSLNGRAAVSFSVGTSSSDRLLIIITVSRKLSDRTRDDTRQRFIWPGRRAMSPETSETRPQLSAALVLVKPENRYP